ncbi:MAG: nickel-dependent lactate racemase [Clostridia bacterium]|nr:nickel-dependent lactate racemase [Clostridia bacterium]
MVTKISLKYGKGTLDVNVPQKNLMGILEPADLPGVPDELEEIRNALTNPIESEPLSVLAKGKENVVILVSDITRPCPSSKLLPPIVEELNKAGVRDDQITVVFGLGFHRGHTREEQEQLIGKEMFARLICLDHDRNDCVHIGNTSRGTPVEIFRKVAEADFLIATGNIEFHYNAGYTAGDKALFPGVCSQRSIEANHQTMIYPGTETGKLEGNPMREDIEEAGGLAGIKFIVNVVLNSKKEIVKAVAGHRIKAHREGVKWVDKMYKRSIPHPADVVIACCGGSPKDINLYQAQKGFENASYAVRKGGIIILVAECPEHYGEPLFEEWITRAQSVEEPIKWVQEKFVLGAHKAVVFCQVLKEKEGYLVSSMPDEMAKNCFFHPFATVEEAVAKALEKQGQDAKVLVMPNANTTVPFISDNN